MQSLTNKSKKSMHAFIKYVFFYFKTVILIQFNHLCYVS
jgi:hypothetical protein